MKKDILNNDAYYKIAWSKIYKFDKYDAMKILPELSGILCLMYKDKGKYKYLLFHSCWRDGLRVGLKKFIDPIFTKFPDILQEIDMHNLYYKYTSVESSIKDLQDIMYWLIISYNSQFNNSENFNDSQRYKNINVKEYVLRKDDIVERFPGHR